MQFYRIEDRDYQQTGAAPTLLEANRAIDAARSDTPESDQVYYVSRIRWSHANNNYEWYWVLR